MYYQTKTEKHYTRQHKLVHVVSNTVYQYENGPNFNESLWYNWLYFASNSQTWLDRITEFGGKKNDETMKIEFPNDDLLDCFYDIWGLEPDEQPKDLQEKIIGKFPVTQLSINDFCNKYGSIKVPLTNSISLAV